MGFDSAVNKNEPQDDAQSPDPQMDNSTMVMVKQSTNISNTNTAA